MKLGLPINFITRLVGNRKEIVTSTLLQLAKPQCGDSFLDVGGPSLGFEKTTQFGELFVINRSKSHMRNLVLSCSQQKFSLVVGDGSYLPLVDGAVDFCYSHATIEHVDRRIRNTFCKEMRRVCKKAYFVSTPNFWFPFEFHYLMPFVQFTPSFIRRLLGAFFSFPHVGSGEEITLLTTNEIKILLGELSEVIGLNRFLGIPATLLGWAEHGKTR